MDFFQQSKYLLNQVDMRLKLVRAQPEFALMKLKADPADAFTAAKIVVEDAILYVRKVKVAPIVINDHIMGLRNQNSIYPVQRCEVLSYTIPMGSLHYDKDNLFRS